MTNPVHPFVDLDSPLANIYKRRQEILDEFCKAYLAELAQAGPVVPSECCLIEDHNLQDGLTVRWHFEKKEPKS